VKGIILAGGMGKRLYPSTISVSKQLLPIYDKPLIYYPLSVLLGIGIREILIISTKRDLNSYKRLFGNGSKLGVSISYCIQEYPRGIADSFIIGKNFIGNDDVCLILGDNIFYGNNLYSTLGDLLTKNIGAFILGYHSNSPNKFGVIEFDSSGNVLSLEEKPRKPKSNYIVPGLYFYKNDVVQMVEKINVSSRNELEITDLNNLYLKNNRLKVKLLENDVIWFDAGDVQNMFEAILFVRKMRVQHNIFVACIEELAWEKGFISDEGLRNLGEELKQTDYGRHILTIMEGKNE